MPILTIDQDDIDVPSFTFDPVDYDKAAEKLGLALLQEIKRPAPPGHKLLTLPKGTLGGGKLTGAYDLTAFIEVQAGEGEGGMFTILQPSDEDAQGVVKMQSIKSGISLLSPTTFNALTMLDFWNPIYSWRRGVLMQYVPKHTVYDPASKTYDLETNFIANVKNSQHFKNEDKDSPEYQFISLLDVKLEDMKTKIKTYFDNVFARLKTTNGILDYLTLAESRRRIYRPIPLNEFGLTLPYAVNYDHAPETRFEMTETGDIQPIPARGMQYFHKLTATQDKGSLAGFDPSLIPEPDDDAAPLPREEPPISGNEAMAMMDVSAVYQTPITFSSRRVCPFRRANNCGQRRAEPKRISSSELGEPVTI